jgi:hypothetical protein
MTGAGTVAVANKKIIDEYCKSLQVGPVACRLSPVACRLSPVHVQPLLVVSVDGHLGHQFCHHHRLNSHSTTSLPFPPTYVIGGQSAGLSVSMSPDDEFEGEDDVE